MTFLLESLQVYVHSWQVNTLTGWLTNRHCYRLSYIAVISQFDTHDLNKFHFVLSLFDTEMFFYENLLKNIIVKYHHTQKNYEAKCVVHWLFAIYGSVV